MKKLFFILCVFPLFLFSQSADIDSNKSINNQVNLTNPINLLFKKHLTINKNKLGISGFGVCIYIGQNRQEAQQAKYRFVKSFPEISSIIFERVSPNWKVRVGRYRTRIEAEKLQSLIEKKFQNCFITEITVKDSYFD